MSDATSVVTCFPRHRGEVLLFRRAEDAGTYPGRWGTVTGYVEHDDPLLTARMEIREETAIASFELARRGEPFAFDDTALDRTWKVHPFLFDAGSRDYRLDEETAEAEWTTPTEILRRETVPRLWESYDRVRPTPETIATDDEHGSAYLSLRGLEVLRDEAGMAAVGGGEIGAVREVAEAVLEARESMAALRNRVNRVMATAETPREAEGRAIEGVERAFRTDEAAAERAAEVIAGNRVLTLSRSGTVTSALLEANPGVVVAESRPAREGVDVAERLTGEGLEVTLCTDAAVAHLLGADGVDAVLVGADTILPDGGVVNKTGTRGTAIVASREGIPLYVVAASDKVSHRDEPELESGPPEAVYDGDAGIEAVNPTFDVTPAGLVEAILTERGRLDDADVRDVAAEHRELAAWRASEEQE